MFKAVALLLLVQFTLPISATSKAIDVKNGYEYEVGTGIHDITGNPNGSVMWGYVDLKQQSKGIHIRQFSRAFVVKHKHTNQKIAFVIADIGSISGAVYQEVAKKLKNEVSSDYSQDNIILTATHTHGAPHGGHHHTLYNLIVKKYDPVYFKVLVDGIFESIKKADENLRDGDIFYGKSNLLNGNINRQPLAYAENPESERKEFTHDTDKEMTLLKFVDHNNKVIGAFNWYPVHGTSSEKEFDYITSDNKGLAAQLFEKAMATNYKSNDTFVAGFANSNAGDATPNTSKDIDGDGDWDCETTDNKKCVLENALKQLQKAEAIFEGDLKKLSGPIHVEHKSFNFKNHVIDKSFTGTGKNEKTCSAALGFSKIAGSNTDGPGVIKDSGWSCEDMGIVGRAIFCEPVLDECQGVKPIILQTGDFNPPWTPNVVPITLATIGELAFASVPGEFTTMSGRRLRKQISRILKSTGNKHIIIAGYANTYAGYTTTREEYQLQRYEAASTHFGEFSLAAYLQEFTALAQAIASGTRYDSLGELPNYSHHYEKTARSNYTDSAKMGRNFGDQINELKLVYKRGETVTVEFVGAKPNNDYMFNKNYMSVVYDGPHGKQIVANDTDFSTLYEFKKGWFKSGTVKASWTIPLNTKKGHYQIKHKGHYIIKKGGAPIPYHGSSKSFYVE